MEIIEEILKSISRIELDLYPADSPDRFTYMESSLFHFSINNNQTEQRWKDYKHLSLPSFLSQPRPDRLIPFYGFPVFSKLTEKQKQNLYVAFTQFNAEVVIMLELVLYEGLNGFQSSTNDQVVIDAVKKIRWEEKLHTKGFLRFLKRETPLFPKTSFMLRNNTLLKNSFLTLVKAIPLSVALPAAKVEAFSVYYGKCLRSSYKENNLWVEVNYLHLIDESHHVSFEFDLFKHITATASWGEKIKIIIGNFLFILMLQITFLIGCHRMIKFALPHLSLSAHVKTVLQLGKWILYGFEPYAQTRELIRNQFTKRSFFAKSLFQFMHK